MILFSNLRGVGRRATSDSNRDILNAIGELKTSVNKKQNQIKGLIKNNAKTN